VACDISRRSDGQDAGIEQTARYQRRGHRFTKADRQVKAVADQIPNPVARFDSQFQLRVPQQERAQVRRQDHA
jgi:hypothetical protein